MGFSYLHLSKLVRSSWFRPDRDETPAQAQPDSAQKVVSGAGKQHNYQAVKGPDGVS